MIVLDTHVLVWMIEGGEELGGAARERVEQERLTRGVLVPAITPWEVGLLTRRKRLILSLDTTAWFDLVLATPGFRLAPLHPALAIRAAGLDWDHRDPADRMIVATALEHDAPVMTVDRAILAYAAAGHLKAIDAQL